MLGLKRGTVQLYEREKEWEVEAQNSMLRLKKILGLVIQAIQHIGSTAIPSIKAKPIIDLAIAVNDFDDILAFEKELQKEGLYYQRQASLPGQLLFTAGRFYDGTGDLETHFVYVVHSSSMDWVNHINFKDYLNSTPSAATAYEHLKLTLASQLPSQGDKEKYQEGKFDFIIYTHRKALVRSYLGKTIAIKIDRPLGSVHPKHPDIIYPVNYGYLPGVFSGDGEELDVYLLGVNEPVADYEGRVIGIAYREDDIEDKLIAAPAGVRFTKEQIEQVISFQEQYFKTTIEILQ
ncbi:GrpB family protein [Erysipelotrichaceae bacterium 51-3]